MNETNTFGWRMKKSWFTLFAFVPFIQFIPFFIMNGKVPKKKWLIMGFANILFIVLTIALVLIAPVYRESGFNSIKTPDYPREPAGRPSEPKGRPSILKYHFDLNSMDYLYSDEYAEYEKEVEAYESTEEYKAYLEEVDAYEATEEYQKYLEECDEVFNSEAYQEYSDAWENTYTRGNAISYAGRYIGISSYVLFAILCFFVERYIFLRNLSVNENRNAVYGQLSGRMDFGPAQQTIPQQNPNDVTTQFMASLQPNAQSTYVQNTFTQNSYAVPGTEMAQTGAYNSQAGQQYANYGEPVQELQQFNSYGMQTAEFAGQVPNGAENQAIAVNVNTASEEMLMTLPGMKTIDAKKIIGYRNANGSFKSADEFFASFDAKPHMIVKMQERIVFQSTTEGTQFVGNEHQPQSAMKRFDL